MQKSKFLHLSIDLPENVSISYIPGDVVGIYCPNGTQLVGDILNKLAQDGDQVFRLVASQKKRANCSPN
eukprot:TRINITY_DN13518_c0_g1_i1.p4 TRINITY_DN13518_c0_g1~~TRINITY_DN13518_c0_g1_i1.p4  ORF type:complete len:69 (-),score=10.74 TRINITY_DN13518_c0_g1_i1:141-347(-)